MKDIALTSDIKSLIVDVSEEIKKKNLLNFIHTSLDLNNIDYSSTDIIYSNYLVHSKQYQFFVFANTFKYMIIELFYEEVPKESSNKNLNSFNLYVSNSFFVIYKNSKLYAYQVLNQEYSEDELLNFIKKSFNITISDIYEISDSFLHKLEESVKNKKLIFTNINKKSNKSFLFFLTYLFICICSAVTYDMYKSKILERKKFEKIENIKAEHLKISKMLKFKPFKIEYKRLISTANKFNLKILSFDYKIEVMNIKLSTKNKESIYLFLDEYQSSLLGNSIEKIDTENIFIGIINVKPN
ncbi:MAG: hypothetical protein CL623_06150 [Arcobacter sp.]|nr:hypothetical protein [Arcobacter sp.]|tara:strand:+ start:1014 stop:1907 length:894 start_codon:yes stop_codon:yes gene_type:complete